MDNSWITNALPFWILGIPLVLSVISYMRLPRQGVLVPPDRRHDRRNITGEPVIRAGDTTVSRG